MQGGLRGKGLDQPVKRDEVYLPYRPFLFTPDQIAVLFNVDEKMILRDYLYYEGRSIGSRSKSLMIARNIAPEDKKPEWRIAERELVRFMRFKGFRFYERGVSSS